MHSLMVATPKTMRTSCDTGSITTAPSPSQPSEMQLYLLMLSSAILENLNYVLPPSYCFNDQMDYTRKHPVSTNCLCSDIWNCLFCFIQPQLTQIIM